MIELTDKQKKSVVMQILVSFNKDEEIYSMGRPMVIYEVDHFANVFIKYLNLMDFDIVKKL